MVNKFFWLLIAVVVGDTLAAEYLDMKEVYPWVAPQKRSADRQEDHLDLTVVVAHHRLNLELNHGLISPFFISQHEDQSGRDSYVKGHVNCFYHGSVEGHPEWHVAMSTCQGLRGIFGDPSDRNQYYYIEPTTEGSSISSAHSLYRGYTETVNSSCGVCSKKKHHHTGYRLPPPPSSSSSRLVRRQGSRTRLVEWVLVNDYSQYQAFGENLTAVVLRDLEIANIVDMFYRSLNIRIVVVSTITWTQGNKIQFPSDNNLDLLLERFAVYEPTITVEHDSVMLVTSEDLPGNTLGFAYVGVMCFGELSIGLTEDGNKRLLSVIATITAHELGHIFNMQHDNTSCTCTDPTSRCIMAAVTQTPPATTWSDCSVTYLNEGYRKDLDRCLFNSPQRTLEEPFCGNGIREGTEECDCGSAEECVDKCCNAVTCKLSPGAKCNFGECCTEDCQFHLEGTVCRNASNECDIMEYCSGDSARCPRDLFKQDTTPCNDNQSYCYAGQCPTRDNQCKLYYGTRSAPQSCYSTVNILGSEFGSCGSTSTNFLPCAPENVDCGQIQCDGGTFNGGLVSGLSYTPTTYRLSSQECRSFTLPPGSDTENLGLVQEGTRCGNESMCIAQACTAISSLTYIIPCPVGSNNLTCSGAGICNNLNECSCEVGLVGATCEQSSSAKKLSGGEIAGIFFGLLLGLLLAGGVAALIVFVVCRNNKSSPYVPRSSTHKAKPTLKFDSSAKAKPTLKFNSSAPAATTTPSAPPPKATPSKPLPRAAPPRPVSSEPPPKRMPPRPPPNPALAKPRPSPNPPPKVSPAKPPPPASHSPAPAKPPQPNTRTSGKRPPPLRPPPPRC